MKRKIDFDILESLRGMASLYVVIGHCRAIMWIGGTHYQQLHPRETWSIWQYLMIGLNMLTRLSSEFVIVFFVLSGFSIAHSLRNNKAAMPFYKRRVIRLYPPYLTAIIWAMVVISFIGFVFPHFVDRTYVTPSFDRLAASRNLFEWKTILRNVIYLPDESGLLKPFWSLTQEVIFYLLAPFIFRNTKAYYITSTALFLLSNVLSMLHMAGSTILENFIYFNFFFAVGAYLYNHYEVILAKFSFLTTYKGLAVAAGLFFIMIPISLTDYYMHTSVLAAVMSSILIVYLVTNNTRIPWLINLGRFSYTLYITHYPSVFLFMTFYYMISKATPPYIFNNFLFIPAIFFCVGIAYLQYLVVEKRTKFLLDRLRKSEAAKKESKIEVRQEAESIQVEKKVM